MLKYHPDAKGVRGVGLGTSGTDTAWSGVHNLFPAQLLWNTRVISVPMLQHVLICVVKIQAKLVSFLIFQTVVLVVFLVMVNFFLLLLLEN